MRKQHLFILLITSVNFVLLNCTLYGCFHLLFRKHVVKWKIIIPILFSFSSAPSEAPHLVTTYNSSSTSLVVRWSHLLEKHFQGQPIGYRIWCYSNESENDTKVVRLNYTTNTIRLTNLTVYTMYVIDVSAVSSGGIGPANTAKARTGAEGRKVSIKQSSKDDSKISNLLVITKRISIAAFF